MRRPRDKAPQLRGAGVPVGKIAGASGQSRDVRARRAVVRFAVLRYDKIQELYDEERKKAPEAASDPAANLAEAARKM